MSSKKSTRQTSKPTSISYAINLISWFPPSYVHLKVEYNKNFWFFFAAVSSCLFSILFLLKIRNIFFLFITLILVFEAFFFSKKEMLQETNLCGFVQANEWHNTNWHIQRIISINCRRWFNRFAALCGSRNYSSRPVMYCYMYKNTILYARNLAIFVFSIPMSDSIPLVTVKKVAFFFNFFE